MEDKTKQLLDWTFYFGINVPKFLKKLPDDYIDRIPKVQIGRSVTSIGANYEEAQAAVSKKDFINKIGTCYKEARESVYWIRILKELNSDAKHNETSQNS